MKIHKNILLICCSVLMFTGCSGWLDYTPKDKQTEEQQFSTKAGFYSAVNGVYTKMSTSSLYGYNLSYGPLDAMGVCYNITKSGSLYYFKTASYTSSAVSSTLKTIWSAAYADILNVNLVLEALDKYPEVLTTTDAQLIRGEMLAARAYLHFDLSRMFGPVYSRNSEGSSIPYANSSEIIKRSRLPENELLTDYIIPDLTEAQSLLKDIDPIITEGVLASSSDDGNWMRYRQLRLNYYAVTLLKARVYIWMGDYENALAEALKLTDDGNVASVFPFVNPNKLLANGVNPDRVFSTECLFGFYKSNLSDVYSNEFASTLDSGDLLTPRSGYLDTLFPETADYRRQSQWSGSGTSTGTVAEFIKYKSFEPDEDEPEFWATFFGLMRISEAYYIAAESYANMGDMEKAAQYLNVIKAARGIENVSSNITLSNFTKELKFEYLREFRGEGQIFFMLKRFYQTFAGYSGGVPQFNGADNLTYYISDSPSASVRYNVPVPSDETY